MEHQSEIQIQAQIFQTCYNTIPETRGCLFHVPNEGKMSIMQRQQLLASGLIPGTPDLFLLNNSKTYIFEIKDYDGYLSLAQKYVHALYAGQGFNVYLFREAEPCIDLIKMITLPNGLVRLPYFDEYLSPFNKAHLIRELELAYYKSKASRNTK